MVELETQHIALLLVLAAAWLGLTYRYAVAGALLPSKILRSILLLLALAALAALIIKPQRPVQSGGNVLVQAGQVPSSVIDSLDNSLLVEKAYRTNLPAEPALLSTIREIPASKHIYLTGNAIDAEAIAELRSRNFTYLPEPLVGAYFNKVDWPQVGQVGDTLRVSGDINLNTEKASAYQVILQANGQPVDSGQFSTKFELEYVPKLGGLTKVEIKLSGQKTLQDSLVAYIPVEAPEELNAAILTSYPSAESKYLKGFLGSENHKVYYRSEIAPGIIQEETINKAPLYRLSPESFSQWDVMLVSAAWWATNHRTVNRVLEEITPKLRPGILIFEASANSQIPLKPDVNISLTNQQLVNSLNRLNAAASNQVFRSEQVFKSDEGKYAIFRYPETYTLWLKKDRSRYITLWNTALRQVINRQTKIPQPQLVSNGQAAELQRVIMPEGKWSLLNPELDTLGLFQSDSSMAVLNFLPPAPGLYQLVSDSSRWANTFTGRLNKRQQAEKNNLLAQLSLRNKQQGVLNAYTVYEPIAAWWFVGIFVISAGLLWAIDRWYV
jgi:hypothetical protein